jgi:sialic acid synthase SpsE/spore coat polysaccharide biosynthesis protein SpsF (cytidylyltransferase family)
MKVGLILICRLSSSRLPGKILKEINGRTVLGHIVDRVRLAAGDRQLVVATSTDASDDAIAAYCRRSGLECFRGSLNDVAGRFQACAEHYGWDFAVRVNGDNLFYNKEALSAMLAIVETDMFDVVTNLSRRTFPRGMTVEIVRVSFYAETMRNVTDAGHREHVTSYLYSRPGIGRQYLYENKICPEAADVQLALDTPDDFALAELIMARAGVPPATLGLKEIYRLATCETPPSPWRGKAGPLMIAEIGGNHEGDFAAARDMAEQAIRSGVDCVKFQIYRGDTLVSPVESPDRYKHFQRFELTNDQHVELARMCRSAGVQYLSSVWDMELLDMVDPYMDFYKIGSGDLTAWPLLREFARRGKPLLLSTGLASLDEIMQTVSTIQSVDARYKEPEWLCLLQCTSMYPIPDTDAQLRVMDTLRQATGLAVGYSDHTIGSAAIYAAVAMGAEAIEFHFTDSREDKEFRDHKVSLTGSEVQQLMADVSQITAFRGDGVKVPQPSELADKHEISFRRGVYAKRAIAKGETIRAEDLVLLRPAHGTDVRDYDLVFGASALQDIKPFEALYASKHYSHNNL